MSQTTIQILNDLGDLLKYRLLPLGIIVVIGVLLYRWWRRPTR